MIQVYYLHPQGDKGYKIRKGMWSMVQTYQPEMHLHSARVKHKT